MVEEQKEVSLENLNQEKSENKLTCKYFLKIIFTELKNTDISNKFCITVIEYKEFKIFDDVLSQIGKTYDHNQSIRISWCKLKFCHLKYLRLNRNNAARVM